MVELDPEMRETIEKVISDGQPEVPFNVEDLTRSLKKANVSKEQAIKTLAESEFAKKWAKSMCKVDSEECVTTFSEGLAEYVYENVESAAHD